MPVAVTVFPDPAVGVANDAAPFEQVATSPAITPDSVQFVTDAAVVESYTLFAAVTVGVDITGVMFAVVVAVVLNNV